MPEAIAVSISPPPAAQAGTSEAASGSPQPTDNKSGNGSGGSFSKLVSEHTDKQDHPATHDADGTQAVDVPGGNPLPLALPPVPLQTPTATTTPSDSVSTAVLASVATAGIQTQNQAGRLRDAIDGRLAGTAGTAEQKSLTVSATDTASADGSNGQGGRLPTDTVMQRIQAGVMVANDTQRQNTLTDTGLQDQKPGQYLQVTANNVAARGDGLYALSQGTVLNHQPGADTRAGQVSVQLNTPFSQADWSGALAARVAWQTGQGTQHASIMLNPPELGPIQVNISVQNDQASVQFVAHHGAVRHAIEQAMPQLRDMLGQSGMTLADANVSQHAPGGQQFSGHAFGEGSGSLAGSGVEGLESGDVMVELRQTRSDGLLDAYA